MLPTRLAAGTVCVVAVGAAVADVFPFIVLVRREPTKYTDQGFLNDTQIRCYINVKLSTLLLRNYK